MMFDRTIASKKIWLFIAMVCIASTTQPARVFGWQTNRPIVGKREHNFGTVARGAKTSHTFKVYNPFDQPLRIAHVRSSCGCTRPELPQTVINPGETGSIIAEFNTRSFIGTKSATITAVITHPVRKEIQLRVEGTIRGDIVFEPGELIIPKIQTGESKVVSTQIHHAGAESWKIVDIKSSLDFLNAELKELERRPGSVRYQLLIKMDGDFPVGPIRDLLTIVTNDPAQRQIPLSFFARSNSALTISPRDIDIPVGEATRKKIILKSEHPFRITRAISDDKRFKIGFGEQSRKTHLVTLSYQPVNGAIQPATVPIRFETDLGKGLTQSIQIRVHQ